MSRTNPTTNRPRADRQQTAKQHHGAPTAPSGPKRRSAGTDTPGPAYGARPFRLSPRVALGVVAAVVIAAGLYAWQARQGSQPASLAAGPNTPAYTIVEGQAGYDYPYDPQVLHVKAGRPFLIHLTDHLGGCGLDTVFPGLGRGGTTVIENVPVGATRTVVLDAPHPGTYAYHCGSAMYFGKIVAA